LPMYEVWQDPSELAQAKSDAGRLLGDGLFEDVLAGGTGMLGGRLALNSERLSPLFGDWTQNKPLLAPLNSWAESNQAYAHLRTQLPEFNKAADDLVHFRKTEHTKERMSKFMMSFGDFRPSSVELANHMSSSITDLYAGRQAMAPLAVTPRFSQAMSSWRQTLGGHNPAEADIGMNPNVLSSKSARVIAEVTTHEATHLRQTELELWLLADHLGIGPHPSSLDSQSLTHAFRKVLGSKPEIQPEVNSGRKQVELPFEHLGREIEINPEMVQNVLSVRNGQFLNRSQTAHAQRLLDSEKTSLTGLHYPFHMKEREAFATGNLTNWTRTVRSPLTSVLYGDLDSLHLLKGLNEPADNSPKPQ
jgi:hypothetical protein